MLYFASTDAKLENVLVNFDAELEQCIFRVPMVFMLLLLVYLQLIDAGMAQLEVSIL